jgi:hypothetical protein
MHRDPTVDCVEGELGSFQYVDSGVLDLGVIREQARREERLRTKETASTPVWR